MISFPETLQIVSENFNSVWEMEDVSGGTVPLDFRYTVLDNMIVLLLGIFRRAPCPSDTRGALVPFYFPRGALPLKKNIFVWKFIGHL
jgi:hypothetical protein